VIKTVEELETADLRTEMESQPKYGGANLAAFKLRDWMIQKRLVTPDTREPEKTAILVGEREGEQIIAVKIPAGLRDKDKRGVKREVVTLAIQSGMYFRVTEERTRHAPAEAEINEFPDEFDSIYFEPPET